MTRDQFITAALQAETDDCIPWPFAVRISSGYPAYSFRFEGVQHHVDAHLAVCRRAHGPSMIGEEAAHRCGNKICVNKRHLYWALPRQNMADARPNLRGGGVHRQRLFAPQRADIAASRESLVALGKRYGMEPAYIGRVRRAELGR